MAEAARRRGHAYQVLTDHTQSLAIARGLTPERVAAQRRIVRSLNERFEREEAAGTAPAETPAEGFRLLHGCELEIRADGRLDFDDALLARYDVVVASLHVGTAPVARGADRPGPRTAIRNPNVDIIAHPSGRMIQTRDDLDLDWEAVFAAAAETGTALEMNGSDHRLDLSVERARLAVESGCVLVIDSDAHRTEELDFLRWGVDQARRAWVEPDVVINTRSRADLLAWVAGKAGPSSRADIPTEWRHAPVRCGTAPRAEPPAVPARVPSPAMDPRHRHQRELVALAVTVVGLSRLLDGPLVWAVAGLLFAAVWIGARQVLAEGSLGYAPVPARGADHPGRRRCRRPRCTPHRAARPGHRPGPVRRRLVPRPDRPPRGAGPRSSEPA